MPDTIEQAVRVLMAHSLEAAHALGRRTPASPIFQTVYNRVAAQVLSDPQSDLAPDERRLVASHITVATEDEPRAFMLRVRLTESERADLQHMAEAANMDMSEYVRSRLFG